MTELQVTIGPFRLVGGEPFLTLTDGLELLPELGRLVLWEGAQDVCFESL